jgi:hypothetical protein
MPTAATTATANCGLIIHANGAARIQLTNRSEWSHPWGPLQTAHSVKASSAGHAPTADVVGQRTRSLRSSPPRGAMSRGAGNKPKEWRWRDGELRPENRGVVILTQNEALHEEDQHSRSAASAYDRRYGCRQAQPEHPARSHFHWVIETRAFLKRKGRLPGRPGRTREKLPT